jgi:hypothetical protein
MRVTEADIISLSIISQTLFLILKKFECIIYRIMWSSLTDAVKRKKNLFHIPSKERKYLQKPPSIKKILKHKH